jgi:hypothetical protein
MTPERLAEIRALCEAAPPGAGPTPTHAPDSRRCSGKILIKTR